MNGLLKSGCHRLLRNKFFWLLCVVLCGVGTYSVMIEYIYGSTMVEHYIGFGNFSSPVLLIGLAAFVPLFLGTDYADGTLRNKIIAGRRRTAIYAANWLTVSLAAAVLCACFFVPYSVLGVTLLDGFDPSVSSSVLTVVCPLLIALAGGALYTMIVMSTQNKAHAVTLCLVFSIVMLGAGLAVAGLLAEPEFFGSYHTASDGSIYVEYTTPNPRYVAGFWREVLIFFSRALPGAQAFMLASEVTDGNPVMALYSVAVTALSTVCGVGVFSKKNLK